VKQLRSAFSQDPNKNVHLHLFMQKDGNVQLHK